MNHASSDAVTLRAVPGLPIARPGDDLAGLLAGALEGAGIALVDGDVIVVASKLVSRIHGRFVDLSTVTVSAQAQELAQRIDKDARLVELVLRESTEVSRTAPGVLIVRHRLGFVSANAGIDRSNVAPPGADPDSGPWVLLLPADPDADAAHLRSALGTAAGIDLGVVISDSMGRPFRYGTTGTAIGVAGLPAVVDCRGQRDLFGRVLEDTDIGFADQIATAADLVAGQAGEGRAVIHVRGLAWPRPAPATPASALVRPREQDLYA
ncbi:coenzyme F420-0:L-glutamate ligase [Haliangium sp.]|uniref:coenzyme F420-0:L-glutamate ligase n=1 Tax=Haliangium sp. TaxID=2663208 RepID=UPI003D0A9B05